MRSKEGGGLSLFSGPGSAAACFSDAWVEKVSKTLPELPQQKAGALCHRFCDVRTGCGTLAASGELSSFFDATLAL